MAKLVLAKWWSLHRDDLLLIILHCLTSLLYISMENTKWSNSNAFLTVRRAHTTLQDDDDDYKDHNNNNGYGLNKDDHVKDKHNPNEGHNNKDDHDKGDYDPLIHFPLISRYSPQCWATSCAG